MGVIFVGGVHGVGKGTQCQLLSESTGIPWFSASSIIKTENQSAIATDTKAVADPSGNQNLLLRGVLRVLSTDVTILLDGHFTILNASRSAVRIDVEIFAQLQLQGIVVLKDTPSQICDRLFQRDKRKWDIEKVSLQQAAEIGHAQMVATRLDIPIHLVDAFDESGFLKAVNAMLN